LQAGNTFAERRFISSISIPYYVNPAALTDHAKLPLNFVNAREGQKLADVRR
jgi:hypothetical protein